MDPLHKTDSAISVASKTIEHDHELLTSHGEPPAKRFKSAAHDESARPFTQTTVDPASPMENLIPPLDHAVRPGAHGSPSPIFFDRARSPLLANQPRPPTSPIYRPGPPGLWPSIETPVAHDPVSDYAQDQSPSAADTTGGQQNVRDAVFQASHGTIAVDHDELGSDPGYESDRASFASTSLSSSARDYLYENGRRYHRFREGRYNFPNDEAEQDREDMKHACVKMLCQRLHFAPIDEQAVQNILDIGTGTGIWAIEMGDQFPSANVLGIDLSPIQPDWVPSNVHFVVDDAESEWLYPENHFDYVHSRHTVMAIKDWPKLYQQART